MPRHPTMGFEINAPPQEIVVIVGELLRVVADLRHAPPPLGTLGEIVVSKNYKSAARRYLREMKSEGMNPGMIRERMLELTPFTEAVITGEFAVLPQGSALKATTSAQAETCKAALQLARAHEVEGFELRKPNQERPRLFVLKDSAEDAIQIVHRHWFVPAHFLPEDNGDDGLFDFGR